MAQKLEQVIKIVNRAAANQRQGAFELAFSLHQGRHESGGASQLHAAVPRSRAECRRR
jgi:hypothetical protein